MNQMMRTKKGAYAYAVAIIVLFVAAFLFINWLTDNPEQKETVKDIVSSVNGNSETSEEPIQTNTETTNKNQVTETIPSEEVAS